MLKTFDRTNYIHTRVLSHAVYACTVQHRPPRQLLTDRRALYTLDVSEFYRSRQDLLVVGNGAIAVVYRCVRREKPTSIAKS
jgi:hypothetical protein